MRGSAASSPGETAYPADKKSIQTALIQQAPDSVGFEVQLVLNSGAVDTRHLAE